MLYPVCPTCGRLLADIEVEFSEKYNKILAKGLHSPSGITMNDKKGGSKKDSEDKNEMDKLFNEYRIKKYCCKMRLISYFDHVKYII
jgi:DNA-directed RNA polymerase subunit N (RpoN/RPB10)